VILVMPRVMSRVVHNVTVWHIDIHGHKNKNVRWRYNDSTWSK
jgi:hypothetical protein